MDHPIETSREPDGRWVATTAQVPGLVVYGGSREDALVSARKLAAILCDHDARRAERILVFHPGPNPVLRRQDTAI